MKTNKELLAIAKKQIGNGGAKYRKFVGLGSGQPWCNAFVFWLYADNGCGLLIQWKGNQRTYCPASYKWCQKNLAQIPPFLALPCDIVYFDWDKNGVPNHIGIVENKITTTATHTIEGNTSGGKVDDKSRAAKYELAIFRTHFPTTGKKKKLSCNGNFGYNSIFNLQDALCLKPTGILDKETVMQLQKKAGAKQDGAWGNGTSKAVQTMLKKAKLYSGSIDGDFGKNSVIALQKWINNINYPPKKKTPSNPKSDAPATKPKGKLYDGKFPTENNNTKIINGLMYRHCWPYRTPEKKYTYKNGKPLKAYTKGIDKAYPNHKNWKNKKQKVGACCDVAVGEWLGNIGIKVPKDLKNQLKEMPKMKQLKSNGIYKAKVFRGGMICQRGRKDYSGHTWGVFEDIHGNRFIANAHYKKLNGTYAVMDAKPKDIVKSKWKFYKCYTVTGAVRKYYMKGDYGKDVYYIQLFLKWCGYSVNADGDFGAKTEAAVKAYQKKHGMTQSGKVGDAFIKKMKAERR